MHEIICISCWSSFEVDLSTTTPGKNVSCPHCGFEQPGPGPKGTPTRNPAGATPPPVPGSDAAKAGKSRKTKVLPVAPMRASAAATPPPAPPRGPTTQPGQDLDVEEIEEPTLAGGIPAMELEEELQPPEEKTLATGIPAMMLDDEEASSLDELRAAAEAAVAGDQATAAEAAAKARAAEIHASAAHEAARPRSGASRRSPSSVVSAPSPGQLEEDDPFAALGTEQIQDTQLTDAATASQVLEELMSDPPPAVRPSGPPPDDAVRWRLETDSGLRLHFPSFDSAMKWAASADTEGLQVALGHGAARDWGAFRQALRQHDEPEAALASLSSGATPPPSRPPAAGGEESETAQPRPRSGGRKSGKSTGGGSGSKKRRRKRATSEEEEPEAPQPRSRKKRRAQATTEFTFRKVHQRSPWPGRVVFLALGLTVGGGGIYYLAWLGVLPGVLY